MAQNFLNQITKTKTKQFSKEELLETAKTHNNKKNNRTNTKTKELTKTQIKTIKQKREQIKNPESQKPKTGKPFTVQKTTSPKAPTRKVKRCRKTKDIYKKYNKLGRQNKKWGR